MDLLFYRNDGLGAVGNLTGGQFQETQSIPAGGFATNWSQIVAVGDQLLFYSNDGSGAVGNLTGGQFQGTQSIPAGSFATNWSIIVSV